MKKRSQKSVSFQAEAPYYTLGTLSDKTKTIWLVCHGFGQLAQHFVRRFDILDLENHFIIAPQGPDRYYYANYQKVGASWTTRENLQMHLANQQAYLDEVFEAETKNVDWDNVSLNALGFSQGVSVITRWLVHAQQPFDRLLLWAGGFPPELTKEKWAFMKSEASVEIFVGDEDEYLNEERIARQKELLTTAFDHYELTIFSGRHELKREVLGDII